MPAAKLNRDLPYGVVYGDPKRFYEQGGIHYGPNEEFVDEWSTKELLLNEKKIADAQKAKEARLALRRQIMEKNRIIKEEL